MKSASGLNIASREKWARRRAGDSTGTWRVKQGVLALIVGLLASAEALAWGERGHDLIARIAARHIIAQGDARLYPPFQQREFLLGHLANVPDIIWKAEDMDEEARRINRPTHYINLDLFEPRPSTVFDLPRSYAEVDARSRRRQANQQQQAGSAPWRIAQLYRLMRAAFEQAGQAEQHDEPGREDFIRQVNLALFYGGIMAHFVGDLANPHHTAADYDGQQTGNGGLHSYFESAIVAVLELKLAHEVLNLVNASELIDKKLLGRYTSQQVLEIKHDPLLLIFALSMNSRAQLPTLINLDDRHSLLERSRGEDTPAKRKPPAEVKQYYASFITERLALAATVLSHLWQLAWEQAGQPDLSTFHSYYYPAKPAFIYPDYLP